MSTKSQNQIFDGTSNAIFQQQTALGSYARVSFLQAKGGALNVIYDRDAQWVDVYIEKTFGKIPQTLTQEEITKVLCKIRKSIRLIAVLSFLGLGRKNPEYSGHHYFEQPSSLYGQLEILLVLAAKQMFEKYTRVETRIVAMSSTNQNECSYLLVLKDRDLKRPMVAFDATQRLPVFHLKGLDAGILYGNFRLLNNAVRVAAATTEWGAQKKSFSLFGEAGQDLNFQITGRTPAEKRFEKDEEAIKNACGDTLVPIELNYHPFWRPLGHTTLRVGRHLYELSATGWKAHNQGANTARAFIFNNPFFKKQLRLFADKNIAPMSIGVTLMVAKSKVDLLLVILENLVAAQGPAKEKFSLLKNNCNQGIVRVLTQAGIEGFDHKGYLEFSTVLTYRQLLLNPSHPVEGLRIYPLPNTVFTESDVRKWIPILLYRNNTTQREIIRALPVFPRDFVYINWKRLVQFIQEGGRNAENL